MQRPVAIVLGAVVRPDGSASSTLRRRAEKAASLYATGQVTKIVATGGVGRHPPAEAVVLRGLLLGCGVPETAILIEDRSHNTMENISFSRDLLPARAPIVLVTDPWHVPRARLVARRLGLQATAAPTSLKGADPRTVAKFALREAVALVAYLLRPMR